MRILAIDSSSLVATVAIVEDDTLVAEYTVNYKKTHSQTLLSMINEIAQMTELDINTIDAIAVAGGPGSFTGLRIGSATAKGMGLALDKPIINVPTIDAMAYGIYDTDKIICPIMDARRNQVYTGLYSNSDEKFEVIMQQNAMSVDELIDILNKKGTPVIFMGDGVPVHKEVLKEKLTVKAYFAPAHLSRQRAGSLGALAVEYYKQGKIENPDRHVPDYLRKSQAEREREERNKE